MSPVGGDVTSMAPENETLLSDRRTEYSAHVVLILMLMVAINLLAITGNVCVMAVIIRTPHLRGQLTYVFVLNLCVADLLCSVTVLPVAISAYAMDSWPLGEAFCNANGFLSGIVTLTSISSICVISMERYYSIKMPMHYAANMTLQRTLFVIACVWIQSALIALCPLLGWNSYKFRQHKAFCSFTWNADSAHRAYVIMLGVVCFVIPSLVLLTMYCAIYRVAKKTANQIGPSRTVSLISNGGISQFPFLNASRFLNGTRCGEHQGSGPVPQIAIRPENGTSLTPPKLPGVCINGEEYVGQNSDAAVTNKKYRGHWKAMKTVVFIMSIFMILWGPYFIMNIVGAINGRISQPEAVELFTTWLGFSAFAINPFVYGWLNRTVRDAFFAILEDLKNSICQPTDNSMDEMNADEDFFQFLERTSTTRTQSIPINRTGAISGGNPPIVEELETYNSNSISR